MDCRAAAKRITVSVGNAGIADAGAAADCDRDANDNANAGAFADTDSRADRDVDGHATCKCKRDHVTYALTNDDHHPERYESTADCHIHTCGFTDPQRDLYDDDANIDTEPLVVPDRDGVTNGDCDLGFGNRDDDPHAATSRHYDGNTHRYGLADPESFADGDQFATH